MPSTNETTQHDPPPSGASLPSIRTLFGLGPTDDLGDVNRRQIQIVQDPRSASLNPILRPTETHPQPGHRSSYSSNPRLMQPPIPNPTQSNHALLPEELSQSSYSRSPPHRSFSTLRPILTDNPQSHGPDGPMARPHQSHSYRDQQSPTSSDHFFTHSNSDSRHAPDGGGFHDVRSADIRKSPPPLARRPRADSTSAPYTGRQQPDRSEDSGGRLAYAKTPVISTSSGQWRVSSSNPIGQGVVGSHTSQINMRPTRNLMDIAIAQEASGSGQKYECSWCHKTFNRPSSLAIHKNIHTGEKPFVCNAPGCGRSFSVLSNMRRHARTHDSSSSRGKRRSKASHMRKEGDPEADGEGGEDEDPNSGGRAVADIQDADSADSTRTSRMTDTRSDRRSRFPSSSQASSTTMATTSELELEWAADEARASHTARERHHFRDRDRRPSPIFTSSEDELDTETEGKQLSRA